MNKKKKILAGVIAAAAAAAVVLVLIFTHTSSSGSGSVYVQKVKAVNARESGLMNRFSGTVETQKKEKVTLDTDRNVKKVYVKEGQKVEEGDKLFLYDTRSTDIEVQQGELEIERLKTTIDNDNTQIATLQSSMNAASAADKPTYSAEILELQAEVAQSEYDIKTKEAEIEKLKASMENATVTATMSGTVESIKDVSELTDAEDKTYITIVADGDFRIKVKINEQNISEVSEGEAVIVRSRVDDSSWKGTITQIDTQQSEEDSTEEYYYSSGESSNSYAFYVDLETTDGLMLGQHVTVEEDQGQEEMSEGIWLSSGWIVMDEDAAYVWAVSEPGKGLEKRSVTLGTYKEEADVYEITDGLTDSDYLAWPDEDCCQGEGTTTERETEETEDSGIVATDEDGYDDEDYDEDYDDEDVLTDYTDEEEDYLDETAGANAGTTAVTSAGGAIAIAE